MQQYTEAEEYTNSDLELSLIAAVAQDPDVYCQVLDYLPEDHPVAFAFHRDQWEPLAKAIEAGQKPDAVADVEPASDPLAAAKQLGQLYQRRALARLHQRGLVRLRDGEPVADLVYVLEDGLAQVQESIAASRPGQLLWAELLVNEVLSYGRETQEAQQAGRETLGIPTGLKDLDRNLNGVSVGLTVLGGAPGVGKTSLAQQWASHAAQEVPVLYVTFENSPRSLVLKAVCRLGDLSPSDVERGTFDMDKLLAGIQKFSPIARKMAYLEGSRRVTVPYIQARARQAMSTLGAKRCLIVVDYLQKMSHAEGYSNLRENVSSLTGSLRELANRLDSPVLALSSLSRGTNNYNHPTLESLKESGDVEYAADVVLLLGARDDPQANKAARTLDLLIAKNRFGPADQKIPLVFKPALGDFREQVKT
jgi:replicative DNA helicase